MIPDRPAHALVRYPDLVELRTFGPETQSLVESAGVRLRVQVDLVETALHREVQEPTHDRDTRPCAAKRRQYGDAANFTGGLQATRANQVTFPGGGLHVGEYVWHDRVEGVPFVALWNALFLDENSLADVLDRLAVVLPRGEFDDPILPHRGARIHDVRTVMSKRGRLAT
jgi:hypothetical protein